MKPLFLGGHPALDFLNTTLSPHGAQIELIGDGRTFVDWLVSAELLDASTASKLKRGTSSKALDIVAAEARKVRHWANDWLSRWRNGTDGGYETELRYLNSLLERARRYREVVMAVGNFELVERYCIDAPNELIALVAEQIALLITNEEPALVKRCSGPGCTLWFLDRTKAHHRLFCSAEVCGNRAKVAAFRERQRAK